MELCITPRSFNRNMTRKSRLEWPSSAESQPICSAIGRMATDILTLSICQITYLTSWKERLLQKKLTICSLHCSVPTSHAAATNRTIRLRSLGSLGGSFCAASTGGDSTRVSTAVAAQTLPLTSLRLPFFAGCFYQRERPHCNASGGPDEIDGKLCFCIVCERGTLRWSSSGQMHLPCGTSPYEYEA